MAYRPGVIGSGGYQRMRIGEATRLAMAADAPQRAALKASASSKSVTDLDAETKQLLASIRGTGTAPRGKLAKTDSSIKTEEMEPDSARKPKKKKGKKVKKAGGAREAFVRTKTPPAIPWQTAQPAAAQYGARATVEMADDESTPRSLGSGSRSDGADSDDGAGGRLFEPLSNLTEPERARLRAEEDALRELDFGAEEARVRDDADQFVPRPRMSRAELEREADRLHAAEAKKVERRKLEGDGAGAPRAARKAAYAQQEAAVAIQSAFRGKAGRDRAKQFRIEMEKAYERAARSGQVQQEVIDPVTGDVYIVNTESRTYGRTGAVSKLPHIGGRPASEKGRRVRGGPAPRTKPDRRFIGDKQVHDDSALASLERSVQFVESSGGGSGAIDAVDAGSLVPGFRMAQPGGFGKPGSLSGTAGGFSGHPMASPVVRPPSSHTNEFLPRISTTGAGMSDAGYGKQAILDSPLPDAVESARSDVMDPLEAPAVPTTAASLRATVQQALK